MKKAICAVWNFVSVVVVGVAFLAIFFVPVFCVWVADVLFGPDQLPMRFRRWLYRRQCVEGTRLGGLVADSLATLFAAALWFSLPVWATFATVCSELSFFFWDYDDRYAD
ncbi:MAG: hypothetical protein WC518_02510 [Patescibacteria group bacterium]